MNILILHAHWNNRGDEAALRAMIDEIRARIPKVNIQVQIISDIVNSFPYDDIGVITTSFGSDSPWQKKNCIDLLITYLTRGKCVRNARLHEIVTAIQNADIIIHAPGGPSIGDTYKVYEKYYLYRLLLAKRLRKKYFFFAPSMGPFEDRFANIVRRFVINNCTGLCVREGISANYLKSLNVKPKVNITLDSAFQHDINIEKNAYLLSNNPDLTGFLSKYDKIVGVTITDLMWHPTLTGKYKKQIELAFKDFINHITEIGYGVIFIPQLFDKTDDSKLMSGFKNNHCYVLPTTYDCYFQQYLISRLYAVVGMRYHSNIFSAKMGTPFISIAYEQKMKGFMKMLSKEEYCIDVTKLCYQVLNDKFNMLQSNYDEYKNFLLSKKQELKTKSYKTTEILIQAIDQ